MSFRYILPLLVEALAALPDDEEKRDLIGRLEQAVEDVDRALPDDLRAVVDERHIAEKRLDVIDRQREAGVRAQPSSNEEKLRETLEKLKQDSDAHLRAAESRSPGSTLHHRWSGASVALDEALLALDAAPREETP